MNLFQEILEQSKVNKDIITLTKYGDDTFWCGYVVAYSEEDVAIQHFTKFGKSDGIIVHPLSRIQRIDYDDDYCEAMQSVINYSDEIYKPNKINIFPELSDNIYFSIINQFKGDKNIILSIQINNDSYYSGYILDVSELDFSINLVGKIGEDLGISVFKVEDITSINIDDVDNRKRNLLFKRRKTIL
jgi:hypothetical protein